MSFRTALKESAKSTKTTGKLWIKEFCCVRVCVERLAHLQVNVHVRLSCMFTTAFFVVTEKRYCLLFWLDEELVSVVEGKNVMGEVIEGGESMVKFGRSCNQGKILAVGELTYSVLCRKYAMIWLPVAPVEICMLTSCVQSIQDPRVRWRGVNKNLLET